MLEKEVYAKISELISSRTGIIKNVFELPLSGFLKNVHSFRAMPPRLFKGGQYLDIERGHGLALSREDAMLAAIGEALEGYCCYRYFKDDFLITSYQELAPSAISPDELVLFSDSQYERAGFPFAKFKKETVLPWVKGFSLISDNPVFVPACMVYPCFPSFKGDVRVCHFVTTGCACGLSSTEAVLSGLYEVIERDAFAIMWCNRLSMPRVEINQREWLDRFFVHPYNERLKVYLIDITTDFNIPVFMSLFLNNAPKNKKSFMAIGAACSLNPWKAVEKSILEAVQTYFSAFVLSKAGRKEINWQDKDTRLKNAFDHSLAYFNRPDLFPLLEFIIKSKVVKDLGSFRTFSSGNPKDDLAKCIDSIREKGYDIIVVDLTFSDIAALGFSVVKVIIPQAQPLHFFSAENCFKKSRRLYSVPRILRYSHFDTTEQSLNPYIHPFP